MGTSSTPNRNAEQTIRDGRQLTPPRTLPFRAVARTCGGCGDLLTTPPELIRRNAGEIPKCRSCGIRLSVAYIRNRRRVDKDFRRKQQRRVDRNRGRSNAVTVEAAFRHGLQWAGPELEVVARENLTARQVAALLGRSMYAVRHARRKLTDPKWEPSAGIPRT